MRELGSEPAVLESRNCPVDGIRSGTLAFLRVELAGLQDVEKEFLVGEFDGRDGMHAVGVHRSPALPFDHLVVD